MKVTQDPKKVSAGTKQRPFVVVNPRTGQPFPKGPFDLSEDDLKSPAVLRLLPPIKYGGVAGGRHGDLVILNDEAKKKKGSAS